MSGRRSSPPWLVAAVLALALAGCGHIASVAPGGTLRVALSEFRITPQDVRVPAGTVTIVVHNVGLLTHDLVITRNGQTEVSSAPIGPGQSADLQATLAPGQYLIASTILSDQALGAYGTLHVGS